METLQQTKTEIINLLSSALLQNEYLSPDEGKLSELISSITPLLDDKHRKESGKGYAHKTLNSKTLMLTSVLLKGKLESKTVGKKKVYRMKPEYQTQKQTNLEEAMANSIEEQINTTNPNTAEATKEQTTNVEEAAKEQATNLDSVEEQIHSTNPNTEEAAKEQTINVEEATKEQTTNVDSVEEQIHATNPNTEEATKEQTYFEDAVAQDLEEEANSPENSVTSHTSTPTLCKEKMHIAAMLSAVLFLALCFYIVAMSAITLVYTVIKLAKALKKLEQDEVGTQPIFAQVRIQER